MPAVSLAEAKARLGELLDEAIAGVDVTIAREGSPSVRLVAVAVAAVAAAEQKPRPAIDIDRLRRLTASMPMQKQSAGDFVRSMRDTDRY